MALKTPVMAEVAFNLILTSNQTNQDPPTKAITDLPKPTHLNKKSLQTFQNKNIFDICNMFLNFSQKIKFNLVNKIKLIVKIFLEIVKN